MEQALEVFIQSGAKVILAIVVIAFILWVILTLKRAFAEARRIMLLIADKIPDRKSVVDKEKTTEQNIKIDLYALCTAAKVDPAYYDNFVGLTLEELLFLRTVMLEADKHS